MVLGNSPAKIPIQCAQSKKQLENTSALAVKQIEAAANETSKKLKAEILLKEKQVWIREFRETVNEILYWSDPDLDRVLQHSPEERLRLILRLIYKIDLMLPVGEDNVKLAEANRLLIVYLQKDESPIKRLQNGEEITKLTRQILEDELKKVEAGL